MVLTAIGASVAAILSLAASVAGATPTLLYVDDTAPAGGDGAAWATAYTDLQDALDEANALTRKVEIRIAAGEYRPDRGTRNSALSFLVRGGVTLLGGFPDGGGALRDRDPALHETVLTGDLAGNDDPELEWTRFDNTQRIIDIAPGPGDVMLQGLTIADGEGYAPGAAIAIEPGAPFVALLHCVVRDNRSSERGGAIFLNARRPEGFQLLIEDCQLARNMSVEQGGAVFIADGLVRFRRSEFLQNAAGDVGGAIFGLYIAAIERCHFEGNEAWSGGAIWSGHQLEVTRSTFRANTTLTDGGAIMGGAVFVERTQFVGNRASGNGGAVAVGTGNVGGAYLEAQASLFIGNSAGGRGGAIYGGFPPQSVGVLTGVTVVGNHADVVGGAEMWGYGDGLQRHRGLILWGNTDAAHGPGTLEAQINIERGPPSGSVIEGASEDAVLRITGAAPRFLDPLGPDGLPATGDEDYRLRADSPAIDLGETSDNAQSAYPPFSFVDTSWGIDSLSRYVDGDGDGLREFDAGAYESQDCDGDGILDSLAIELGLATDCNGNGVPDQCEFRSVDVIARDIISMPIAVAPPLDASGEPEVFFLHHPSGSDPAILGASRVDGELCTTRRIPIIEREAPEGMLPVTPRLLVDGASLVVAQRFSRALWLEEYTISGNTVLGPTPIPFPGEGPRAELLEPTRSGNLIAIRKPDAVTVLRRSAAGWSVEWTTPAGPEWGYRTAYVGAGLVAWPEIAPDGARTIRSAHFSNGEWALLDNVTGFPMGGFWNHPILALDPAGHWMAATPEFGQGDEARIAIWERRGDAWGARTLLPQAAPQLTERIWSVTATRQGLVAGYEFFFPERGQLSGLGSWIRKGPGQWVYNALAFDPEVERLLYRMDLHPSGDQFFAPSSERGIVVFGSMASDMNANAIPDDCDRAQCPADLNIDGLVDGADLGQLLGLWGPSDRAADLNADGVVDGADLRLLVQAWGVCP